MASHYYTINRTVQTIRWSLFSLPLLPPSSPSLLLTLLTPVFLPPPSFLLLFPDFQNLVVQLAMRGESDSALLLFHSLGIGMQNALTGRVVVRSVLQGGAEIEEVLRVVQQLRALGITQVRKGWGGGGGAEKCTCVL